MLKKTRQMVLLLLILIPLKGVLAQEPNSGTHNPDPASSKAAASKPPVDFSGESEIGTNGLAQHFFSQYIFFDAPHWNGFARYFYERGAVNRAEFGFGPTIHLPNERGELKLQFGGTTSGQIMMAETLAVRLGGRSIIYVADAKFATNEHDHNTLYQKLWVPITRSGWLQFRGEHLFVGQKQEFFRPGFELRKKLSNKRELFFAPFYDPIHQAPGIQGGFRFF